MSIGNANPDRPDNFITPALPDVRPDMISHMHTVITETTSGRYNMNLAAAIMQNTTATTLDTVQQQHDKTESLLASYGNTLIRLIQAQAAYDDVFFDAVSRTEAQLQAFVASDSQDPIPGCPPAAVWHEQIEDYRPVSELRLPGFLQNFGIEIAPRIRTVLPADADSGQTGYLQTSGAYLGEPYPRHDGIDMEAVGRLRVPLLATVKQSAKLSPPVNPHSVTGPDYARQISEYFLTENHKRFSSRLLKKAITVDAVAVTPGISQIGNIVSTDMCVNLGWQDFAEGESPGAYQVILLKNGMPQNGRVIDPASDSRLLGSITGNPFLSVPPPRPDDLHEWRDNEPFTREISDMHLSVVGIPVTALHSRTDPHYTPKQPAVKHVQDGATMLLQRDRERVPFMVNVAVVASY